MFVEVKKARFILIFSWRFLLEAHPFRERNLISRIYECYAIYECCASRSEIPSWRFLFKQDILSLFFCKLQIV